MSNNNTTTVSLGGGFSGLLTIALVLLKLLGKITISWWWVFSPIIITWGIGLAFLAVIVLAAVVIALLD